MGNTELCFLHFLYLHCGNSRTILLDVEVMLSTNQSSTKASYLISFFLHLQTKLRISWPFVTNSAEINSFRRTLSIFPSWNSDRITTMLKQNKRTKQKTHNSFLAVPSIFCWVVVKSIDIQCNPSFFFLNPAFFLTLPSLHTHSLSTKKVC